MSFPSDEFFMSQALLAARAAFEADEVPVGAVIVSDQQIVARAHNQVEMLRDPTAHAEIIAITQAVNTLQSKWLNDCTMYVTLEPCAMCAGALVLARVSRLVFATEDPKTGACGSVLNIVNHPTLNHRMVVDQGILRGECAHILTDFFQRKRHIRN
ncbi:MAG: tRNA adenosine(34) deaminase TadA [Candidatus Omnitrophica bacterium]|nr:tRNA adenosine(34) deaminase TadA [Candidatus Omnitrophota bacterium]